MKRARTDVEHSHRVQVKQCTFHLSLIAGEFAASGIAEPSVDLASLKCDASDASDVNSWSVMLVMLRMSGFAVAQRFDPGLQKLQNCYNVTIDGFILKNLAGDPRSRMANARSVAGKDGSR